MQRTRAHRRFGILAVRSIVHGSPIHANAMQRPQPEWTPALRFFRKGERLFCFSVPIDRSWFPNPRSCSGLVANAAVVPLMQRPCRFNPITTTITRFNVLLPRYHGNFCLFDTSGSSSASSTSQEIPEDISEFFEGIDFFCDIFAF